MRAMFPGYYAPTSEDIDTLWDTAWFVPDANVLLNLYRIDLHASDDFLGLLSDLGDRLWVPHQAALEYHENRLDVLRARATVVGDFSSALERGQGTVQAAIGQLARHPAIDHQLMLEDVDAFFGALRDRLAEVEASNPELFAHDIRGDDPVLARLTAVLDGRVGPEYEHTRRRELQEIARLRYADRVPPGYCDKSKPEPEQFGDYIIWREVLDHAAQTSRPIIFITDDTKEDWWRLVHGQRLGPRPELVLEMLAESGQQLLMYTSSRFLEEASMRRNRSLGVGTIREVERAPERALASKSPRDQGDEASAPPPAVQQHGVSGPDVCRVAKITYRQLDYWARTGLVGPSISEARGPGTRRLYSYEDLIRIAVLGRLLDAGIPLTRGRRVMEALEGSSLAELDGNIVLTDEGTLLVASDDALVDALGRSGGTLHIVPMEGLRREVNASLWQSVGDKPSDRSDDRQAKPGQDDGKTLAIGDDRGR